MQSTQESRFPRWFVRQDIDGFFGLGLDNLIQILVIVSLTQGVLNFPSEIVYGRILPSVAISLIVGNVYYSWLAYQRGKAEGRDDITALPYGINTISLFVYIFLVMLPVQSQAMADGASATEAAEMAWQAGMVACLGSGMIELGGGLDRRSRSSLYPPCCPFSNPSRDCFNFSGVKLSLAHLCLSGGCHGSLIHCFPHLFR